MRNSILFLFVFLFNYINAQDLLWEMETGKDIYYKQLDEGSLFVKDGKKLSLINHLTGESIWSLELEADNEVNFFDNIPVMYFDGKSFAIIDASSGEMIVDDQTKTEILDIHYLWDMSRILLELDQDGELIVYNYDMKNPKASWKAPVGEVKKSMFGLVKRASANKPSVSKSGNLAMLDKKDLAIFDTNGQLKNTINFEDDVEKVAFNEGNGMLYLIEDKKTLHFINLDNAKEEEELKLSEKNPSITILKSNNIAIPQKKDLILFDGTNGSEINRISFDDEINYAYYDDMSDKLFALVKKSIFEISQSDGSVENEIKTDTDYNNMYRVNDDLFVDKYGKTNVVNTERSKLMYDKNINFPHVDESIDEGRVKLFFYYGPETYQIAAVTKTGEVAWDDKVNTADNPRIEILSKGLLLITNKSLEFIDKKTGVSLWDSSLKVDPSFSYAVNDSTNTWIFYAKDKVYFMNEKSGRMKEPKEKIKFKDFDYNTQQPLIIPNQKGAFIKGSNSIFVVDSRGNVTQEAHYKTTESSSGLLKIASFAVTAGAIATGNASEVVTVYSGDKMVHKGSLVDGINDTWALADAKVAERRMKQNQSSSVYPYVLAKNDDGDPEIIIFNVDTGKEYKTISVETKSPNFIVDDIDAVVYVAEKNSLKAFGIR
ncbi:MAG TPA: hypothetical protein PK147_02615 [Saprospiraceae bacterium]|nr:hypothetical protein [Saprospiraceae bacterium]MCB9328093.1 hypothetical protein [Lewinellaceae bacterium]HPK09280.1 hypothetical protein [Saprospiraceae bacterium]HPQ20711.1 hypothetical protein [Saprospiraceae bacterium]